MRRETKKAFDNIIETIYGGGAAFVEFMLTIKELDKAAESGNEMAKEAIDIVKKFNKLIEISQWPRKEDG